MILFFYEEEYATEVSAETCKGLIIAEDYTDAMNKLKGTDYNKYSISVKLTPIIRDTSLKGEHMQLSMSFDGSVSNDNYKAILKNISIDSFS